MCAIFNSILDIAWIWTTVPFSFPFSPYQMMWTTSDTVDGPGVGAITMDWKMTNKKLMVDIKQIKRHKIWIHPPWSCNHNLFMVALCIDLLASPTLKPSIPSTTRSCEYALEHFTLHPWKLCMWKLMGPICTTGERNYVSIIPLKLNPSQTTLHMP